MSVTFRPVESEEDIQKLAELADEIWHEYWPSRIGAAQTDYMVQQFQSLEAIKRDMAEHDYEYWFLVATDDADESTNQGADEGSHQEQNEEAGKNPQGGSFAKKSTPSARIVGYTGGHVEPETNRFFISKIYLLANERGHHFGSATTRFYEQLCADRGLRAMYLTVNKENDLAIRAYLGTGFKIIDATETDIGEGFIMDDYIMEKEIALA